MEDNTSSFDNMAVHSTKDWDQQIAEGRYLRGELFLQAAKSFVRPGGYILDYGCGPGRISVLLARNGFRVLGLDPTPEMLAMAKRQKLDGLKVDFQICSFSPEELPSEEFDGVVCSSVIEYAPDPAQFLQVLRASLRPTGVLLISFANHLSLTRVWYNLARRDDYLAARKHTWTGPRFLELLRANGYTPEQPPRYFNSSFDRVAPLRFLSASRFWGGLGLVIARKK